MTSLNTPRSFRNLFRAAALGAIVCAFGLSVSFSAPAWGQDSSDNLLADRSERLEEAGYNQSLEESLSTKLSKEISLHVEGVVLEEVLERIVEKGGIKLVYGQFPVLSEKELSLHRDSVTVQEAFEEAIRDTGLDPLLSRSGHLVLVKRSSVTTTPKMRESASGFAAHKFQVEPAEIQSIGGTPSPSWSQEGTIEGTVTDQTSEEPLPGVNVVIVNTRQGATTDKQGNFRISNVEQGSYTLQASFVGYETTAKDITVEAGETSTVNFALARSEIALEEMVVTALGIERRERALSYSSQSVAAADIQKARELNIGASLKGRVSGLSMQQGSNGVGSDVRMVLRGNKSISGSSQPLIVVDGAPIRGGLGDINPDYVKNIEVLKGPNAAALYGNEAQNGAILVTTRSPESGQLEVSFTENIQARRPNFQIPLQNVYGQGVNGEYSPSASSSWGPKMDGQMVPHWSPAPELQGEEYALTPQPDNFRDVFQTGWNSSTNVSASMGAESIQGLVSYTHTRAQGTVPENTLERHNFLVKASGQPTEDISMVGKVSYVRENIEGDINSQSRTTNTARYALQMPRSIHTEHLEKFEYFTPAGLRRQNFWNPGQPGGGNPYWGINRVVDDSKMDGVRALLRGTYSLTSYFDLRLQASIDADGTQSTKKIYNDTYEVAPQGSYSVSKRNGLRWDGNAMLSYDDNITENLRITVDAGGNWRQERESFLNSNTGRALTVPNFFSLSNTTTLQTSSSEIPKDVQSVFGRGEVSWNDAIFLQGTARNDWSSTLPQDSWSFFYPSVGLSVVLTDLFPGVFPDVMNFVKVSGSWAEVGSEAPPFRTVRTASFSQGGRVGFLNLSGTLPAEDLKPEQTESWEVGAQIQSFDGRLGVDATFYQSFTRNQLFTVALPVASGASAEFTNGGNVRNRGVEFTAFGTPLQSENLQWDATVNFSANRNLVKKIHDRRERISIGGSIAGTNFVIEGEPFGLQFGRGFVRDDQGRVIVNSDGMPKLTSGEDAVRVADFNPDWTGSIENAFSFGNFNLGFLIDHRQGGRMVSILNSQLAGAGAITRTLKGRGEGVVFGKDIFPGETAVTEGGSPNTTEVNVEDFWRTIGGTSDAALEAFSKSATATKFRELTVGYSLPQSLMGKTPLSQVNISLVARDLFWIYKESESINPDLIQSTEGPGGEGLQSYSAPDTRSFGLNINIVY